MTDTVAEPAARRGRAAEPRPEKVAVVDEVREKLSAAEAAILTEYRGLSVADLEGLRRSLRQAGGEYKVYKNTLVRFATRELGIDGIEPLLAGPTAIAFASADVPAVAKALRDFSRTNPLLVVKGGVMGSSLLTAADAAALAEIPSRERLLAQLAGLMAAPMQQLAGLLQALPRNFAYGLKALIDERGGVPEAPAEVAPADVADAPVTDAPPDAPADVADAPAADAPVADAPADAPVDAEPAPEPAATGAAATEPALTDTDPTTSPEEATEPMPAPAADAAPATTDDPTIEGAD